MSKIKILFVDHAPFVGGAQLCLAAHIAHLDKQQFTPYLVIDRASRCGKLFEEGNVPQFKITFEQLKGNFRSPARLRRSVREFNQLVDKLKPDIVVANTTRALVVSALAHKKFKLISYVRDYDYPKWLMKLLAGRVDRFWMVSQSIQRFYGLPKQKTVVVYLGSPMLEKLKRVQKRQVQEYKQRLGIKRGEKVVGFVGRLVDWKGVDTLVEAMKLVDTAKLKLVVFGSGQGQEGDMEEKLRRMVRDSGLENRVVFAGFEKNQALVFQLIDILVLSSKKAEPFATSVIEAALAQKVVVATKIGGTTEFVRHGKNGLLFQPSNSLSLAKSLMKIVGDAAMAKRLAKQAFVDAQRFDERAFATTLEKMYAQVVSSDL